MARNNIGRKIKDCHCGGIAGGRYDLQYAVIEAEADDYIVVRTLRGEPVLIWIPDKNTTVDMWARPQPG